MLVFKNNIYDPSPGLDAARPGNPGDPGGRFDPLTFIRTGLEEEADAIAIIQRQPKVFWKEDAKSFYPNSGKIGSLPLLANLLRILVRGLEGPSSWHHMNAYHFCFLYDILKRHAYNYNHDSPEEKLKLFPRLRGKPVNFPLFVKDYFFGTAFLINPEKFNALSRKEKDQHGLKDACLFAVINGLMPTPEEMALVERMDYPYSIYV